MDVDHSNDDGGNRCSLGKDLTTPGQTLDIAVALETLKPWTGGCWLGLLFGLLPWLLRVACVFLTLL